MTGKLRSLAARTAERECHSWHMPGHKGALCPLDTTELDFGREFPARELAAAEEDAAKFYGAKRVRFLTGGASMGIKAAVMAVGRDIIAPENSHQSVFEGAQLAGVKVFKVPVENRDGLKLPPSVEAIERAARDNPSAGAAVITSPDYFGLTLSEKVYWAARALGLAFIADSAHGAHFPASPRFPEGFSALADACVLSAHKTMKALTQTAYLCINDAGLFGQADRALKLLGTTSPSYPLLYSLEEAISFAGQAGAVYEALYNAVCELKTEIPTLDNGDFTRLVVDAQKMGFSGHGLYSKIRALGHEPEIYTEKYVVFIVTACDTPKDVASLKAALKDCAKAL